MPSELKIKCPSTVNEVASHEMHVWQWGDENNPDVLICVHGLTRNGRDFDFLAKQLEHKYRIICPDVIGRGKSQYLKNTAEYNYITYVADMLHMMEVLKISQCKWVGTSMGGLIGMMIAANVDGVIKKLMLNDIGPFVPKEGLNRIGQYVGLDPQFKKRKEAEEYVKKLLAPWNIPDEKHMQHFVDNSIAKKGKKYSLNYHAGIGDAFKDETGKPAKMQDIDMWIMWENITCPVMVLRGSSSDLLTRPTIERMALKKNVSAHEVEKTGHAPSLSDAAQISAIVNWL